MTLLLKETKIIAESPLPVRGGLLKPLPWPVSHFSLEHSELVARSFLPQAW